MLKLLGDSFSVQSVCLLSRKGTDTSADMGKEAGTVNWYRHIEIGMEVFQNLKVDLLFDPALLLQESMSKSAYHGDTCTSMQYSQ